MITAETTCRSFSFERSRLDTVCGVLALQAELVAEANATPLAIVAR